MARTGQDPRADIHRQQNDARFTRDSRLGLRSQARKLHEVTLPGFDRSCGDASLDLWIFRRRIERRVGARRGPPQIQEGRDASRRQLEPLHLPTLSALAAPIIPYGGRDVRVTGDVADAEDVDAGV